MKSKIQNLESLNDTSLLQLNSDIQRSPSLGDMARGLESAVDGPSDDLLTETKNDDEDEEEEDDDEETEEDEEEDKKQKAAKSKSEKPKATKE